MTRYLGWVRGSISHRGRTALAAGAFLALSALMVLSLKTAFFPAQDKAQTQIAIELAPGSNIAQTRSASLHAAQLLRNVAAVKSVFVAVGSSSSENSNGLRKATLIVDLVARSERRQKQAGVEEDIRQMLRQIPGARISVGGGNSGEKLQITLAGSNPDGLVATATALESQLRTLQGIGNVSSSAALQQPEIQFQPDIAHAAALGVTTEALAEAIRIGTYGDYASALPKLNLPERQVTIRAQTDPAQRARLDDIGRLRVAGSKGIVSVATLGTLQMGSGPAQIDRIDRERNITLSIELNGRALGDVDSDVRKLPALQQLPTGVHQVDQGELQSMGELFQSFGLAMAIGILCVYAVLVLLFHDFLQPATILCALPLSLGGALFALLISKMSFSMPAIIGLLMLMGIVTKNSILLVEYAVMARREHALSRLDALVDACHKRARPILMTTIAMAAGMLPNALGLGAEPSFRQPMAIVVIGGLLTSTLLCLLVIPVVFTYVDDLEQWLRRRFTRSAGSGRETA